MTSEQIAALNRIDAETLGTFLGLAEMAEEGYVTGERVKARVVEILVEYRKKQRGMNNG